VRNDHDAFRFFVSSYHPDLLRLPSGGPVVDRRDRLRHALTWNVFRTLEQIAPSAWIRPLVAAIGGLADEYASAPHVCRVTTWQLLEPPPVARLRRGRRNLVRADVIIDTDDTVVSLLIPTVTELTTTVLSDTADGGLHDLIEATSFFAGTRAAYSAVILPPEADNDLWTARVNRRAHAVHRVLLASERGVGNARGLGALGWRRLATILADVANDDWLHGSERLLAQETAGWMSERLARDEPRQQLA
jgi:hypothetical protein